jgi:phytoene desaturase
MDTVAGVFYPRGGMHAVPRAMADAATKHGVDFRFGETVESVDLRGDRAVAVVTSAGRIPCDAVVLNPDLPAARRLVGRPLRRRLRYSPSCVVLHVGSARPADAHHTISFGQAWREVFDELLSGRVMSDPSFFVSAPPGAAPPGRTAYYVLFPTPNLDATVDWGRYVASLWPVLESRGFDLAPEVVHVTTPVDWAARGLERGTPFAAAHTFAQTGPFRPGNLLGDNVVFAGSGTVPGVGVPMVLVSGRLAAERILGP